MKIERLIYVVSLLALMLIICHIHWNAKNQLYQVKEQMVNMRETYNNKIIQYSEAIEYEFDDMNNLSLLSNTPRIGLYIDSRNCTSCWKRALKQLSQWNDSLEFENSPLVIANNFNSREIKIMQKGTKISIHSIGDKADFLIPMTQFNVPFFFVLKDGAITRPLFSLEQMPRELESLYLNHISIILRSKTTRNHSVASSSLTFAKSHVEVGKVELRKKTPIVYQIHNDSDETCLILRCMPSCSCVVVDSFSTAIPAKGDGYIALSTVQLNKGSFSHSINIQTNFQSLPYSVTFAGYCE